jgi:hypothetical protein
MATSTSTDRIGAGPSLRPDHGRDPHADAELRAGLLSAIVHGVIIERYLVRLGRPAGGSPAQSQPATYDG